MDMYPFNRRKRIVTLFTLKFTVKIGFLCIETWVISNDSLNSLKIISEVVLLFYVCKLYRSKYTSAEEKLKK